MHALSVLVSVCFSQILRKENPVSTKGDLGHTEWQELDKDLKVEIDMSLVLRKLVFGVSDQARHKPGCTATEDGYNLEISYIGSRGIVLSV